MESLEILVTEIDKYIDLKNEEFKLLEKKVYANGPEPIIERIEALDEKIEILALKGKELLKL